MPEPVRAADMVAALRLKYPRAAILTEVTMPDEAELARQRTALAARSVYYRRKFTRQGLSIDSDLPEGYDLATSVGARRIDVLMLAGQVFTAIETKVTRADFFKDTAAKRDPWRNHTNRFIYLTPAGLLKKEEIPDGCGLWEYNPDGSITATKRANLNRTPEPFAQGMIRYFMWRAFAAESTHAPRRNRSRRVTKRR